MTVIDYLRILAPQKQKQKQKKTLLVVLVVYWGNEGSATTLVPISLRRDRFIETAGITLIVL